MDWTHPHLSPPTPRACNRCREKRRRCDMGKPGCERCARMKVTCVYSAIEKGTASPSKTLQASLHEPEKASEMSQFVRLVFPSPGAGRAPPPTYLPTTSALEDPDMAATYTDYLLVHNFFLAADLRHASDSPAYYLIDRDCFMATFFSQPPALRLVLCTLAAYTSESALPKHLYVRYYTRAKKALTRVMQTPSLKTIQAIYLTSHFVLVHGQPTLGESLTIAAVKMCAALNMGTDPSHTLGRSKSEQEEYRRCFWRIYYNLKYSKCVNDIYRPFSLIRHDIMLPSGGVRGASPLMIHICAIWDLIYQIRIVLDEPPNSLDDLLAGPRITKLNTTLIDTHAELPSMYILVPDPTLSHDTSLAFAQYAAFVEQMLSVSPNDTTSMLLLSVNYNASICMLLRPRLYLTVFTQPDKLSQDGNFLIKTALEECSAATQRIAELGQFILYLTDNEQEMATSSSFLDPLAKPKPTVLSRSFWMQQIILSHAFFEAAVCLWVISCRSRAAWKDLCASGYVVSLHQGKRYILAISRYYKLVSKRFGKETIAAADASISQPQGKPNMFTPFIDCIDAMVYELELMEMNGGVSPPRQTVGDTEASRMQRIVLDMKAMGIADVEEVVVGSSECPLAFLGLLGLEVNDVYRWKGDREDKWRVFWSEQVFR
ncbi:hypothetical protein BC830DRAFT_1110230 [Chytriomyces sp. MP71]|nr:hypothetical protein BC830DRAFT_1110230 [Chytriomyces sp. MP71]